MFPVAWLPEADAELKAALAHYDTIRTEPGIRLGQAVIETVVEESRIVVIGCFHGKRHPTHWQLR